MDEVQGGTRIFDGGQNFKKKNNNNNTKKKKKK
jgi:hypothetical protein